ncbi:TadE family protein [Nocardioides euryhalodurans]|uniref:Pilus assembly protein n=1 Tax=Nocardioides euryhalodurans TaxID=2518370 RepID=A0A4P7GPC5_9ACTN|nr:TadE/TadG family type IV pilus assembly protein [Nocardioides euryhalodurans]QBR94085.1 pilus assembly protein [Nocardioides euryhalodurans]
MAGIVHRTGREDGAAAVEFALIMPILFLVVFGILQYGLWFNDSLNTRQGVREGARIGVVADFSTETGCTSGGELDKLACKTKNRIDALTGTAYVKVNAASWTKAQPLTVCALVRTETPGLLPMPSDGWIFSKTQMSIEKTTAPPAALTGTYGTLPAGAPAWPSGC